MQRNDCYHNCKLMLKRALIYLFTIILLHVESDANVQFFFSFAFFFFLMLWNVNVELMGIYHLGFACKYLLASH